MRGGVFVSGRRFQAKSEWEQENSSDPSSPVWLEGNCMTGILGQQTEGRAEDAGAALSTPPLPPAKCSVTVRSLSRSGSWGCEYVKDVYLL